MSTVISKSSLFLNVCTSSLNTPASFDYDQLKLQCQKFQISQSSVILYNQKDAQTKVLTLQKYSKNKQIEQFKPVFLVRINSSYQKNIIVQPIKNGYKCQSEQKKSYIIVRFNKLPQQIKKCHQIKCGDVIKFGRISYLVIESKKNSIIQKFKDIGFNKENYIYNKEPILQGICKICFSDQVTYSNYLMNPCKCKGSCEFIHVNCLKKWIENKVKVVSSGVSITYNLNKFECQLCKTPFPTLIYNRNQQIQTMKIEKPQKSYLILESLINQKQSNDKSVHIIFPDQNYPVKLGRSSDCHINIADSSISRIHSIITLQNNKFIIQDKNSKFGTLILLNKDKVLESELHLQCDKSTYSLSLK